MARRQVPEKLLSLLKDIGLSEKESLWDCHGTPVVLHKALEKIALYKRITFSEPTIIHSDPKEKICILNVSGSIGDRTEWSIGEATPYNNKNSYPYAMAEKRAKDRVILKLIDIPGVVYSEEEADDFKQSEKYSKIWCNMKYKKCKYQKKIYVYGIALTADEKALVIKEAKEILDVEDVIASILIVDDLRIQKN